MYVIIKNKEFIWTLYNVYIKFTYDKVNGSRSLVPIHLVGIVPGLEAAKYITRLMINK